ncbi:uncharacterized protein PWA37_001274 [Arxiozyma heterogenica]|uniref:uncharacterized protein n=1 Tax=Arxiozyma heterogenica TaxID=278026 RepID=UPI002F242EB1
MESQTISLILHTHRNQNHQILFFGVAGIYLHTLTSLLLFPPLFFFRDKSWCRSSGFRFVGKNETLGKKREKGETRKIATATNHIRHYHYLCSFVCVCVYIIKLMPCYKIITELYKHIPFFFFFFSVSMYGNKSSKTIRFMPIHQIWSDLI